MPIQELQTEKVYYTFHFSFPTEDFNRGKTKNNDQQKSKKIHCLTDDKEDIAGLIAGLWQNKVISVCLSEKLEFETKKKTTQKQVDKRLPMCNQRQKTQLSRVRNAPAHDQTGLTPSASFFRVCTKLRVY